MQEPPVNPHMCAHEAQCQPQAVPMSAHDHAGCYRRKLLSLVNAHGAATDEQLMLLTAAYMCEASVGACELR